MTKIIKLSASVVERKSELENGEAGESTEYNYAIISGVANATTVDRIGDLIPKSAWKLENFLKNPVMLWEHCSANPIGRVLIVEARDDGLYFEAEIGSKTGKITERQEEIIALLRQGVLKSFSVGFIPKSIERKDDVSIVKEAELLEISLVSVPMNQDSLLTSIKSAASMENESQNSEQQQGNSQEKPAADGGTMEELKAAVAAVAEDLKGCHGKLDKICSKLFPEDEQKPEDQQKPEGEKPNIEVELSALKEELAVAKSALEKANKDNDILCEAIVLSRVGR